MKKAMKDGNTKNISIPWWCYCSLFLLSLVLLVIDYFDIFDAKVATTICNIGFGIFSSTLVAVLIDWASTIQKRNRDLLVFTAITKELKESFYNVICLRKCLSLSRAMSLGELNKKHKNDSFEEWVFYAALRDYSNPAIAYPVGSLKSEPFVIPVVNLLYYIIDDIIEKAISLHDHTAILSANSITPADFVKNLDALISTIDQNDYITDNDYSEESSNVCPSSFLDELSKSKSFSPYQLPSQIPRRGTASGVRTVYRALFMIILKLFPEYDSYIEGEWSDQLLSSIDEMDAAKKFGKLLRDYMKPYEYRYFSTYEKNKFTDNLLDMLDRQKT